MNFLKKSKKMETRRHCNEERLALQRAKMALKELKKLSKNHFNSIQRLSIRTEDSYTVVESRVEGLQRELIRVGSCTKALIPLLEKAGYTFHKGGILVVGCSNPIPNPDGTYWCSLR